MNALMFKTMIFLKLSIANHFLCSTLLCSPVLLTASLLKSPVCFDWSAHTGLVLHCLPFLWSASVCSARLVTTTKLHNCTLQRNSMMHICLSGNGSLMLQFCNILGKLSAANYNQSQGMSIKQIYRKQQHTVLSARITAKLTVLQY